MTSKESRGNLTFLVVFVGGSPGADGSRRMPRGVFGSRGGWTCRVVFFELDGVGGRDLAGGGGGGWFGIIWEIVVLEVVWVCSP